MQILPIYLSRFLTGAAIVVMLVAMAGMQPAMAQEAEEPQATEEEGRIEGEIATEEEEEAAEEPVVIEEIIVKGFRRSLAQSVALKRSAVNARDSIVTEDIAKMPDLNLAESIQRIPGVAIVREGGEGRQMSLRGLGPDFTRVTLNGMEVPASAGGLDTSGGINRGRGFDFNVFPSELFTRIDINKSAIASIEEGGVAGTVEMYTARPLDNPGLQGSVLLQAGYNDLSEDSDPRITATLSTTNQAETVGFMVSGAYMGRTPFQDGFGTVRWAQPDRDFAGNETDLTDAQLNELWYPRLPRQDSFRHDQDRLGLASAVQFRPGDKWDIGVNWVYSKFNAKNNAYNSFGQFRRNGPWGYPNITVTDVTVAQDGTGLYAVAGSFEGVALRTESRQTDDTTEFNQLTADFKYDLSDAMRLSGMIGHATSAYEDLYFRVNIETLDPNIDFSYDFTGDANVAAINYGIDVASTANYVIMDNERLERNLVDRTNDTLRVDLDWDLAGGKHNLKFGAIYNDREVDSQVFRQDASPPSDLAAISYVFNYVDAGGYGSGTELNFVVLDFDKAKAAYGFGDFEFYRGPGRATWVVTEQTAGAYVDYNLDTELGSHAFRVNAGARYVDTSTDALGWLTSDISNTESNSYSNVLPAVNLAFDATEDLVLRAGVSRTMTRAGLDSLAPSKTYTDVNFTVTGGNSQLDPMESDNIDLGIEWYFAEQAVLGVAFFHKDIKSFIGSPISEEPLRPEDYGPVASVYPSQPELLDPSLIWTYSTSANVDGTSLQGFEVAYQQAFRGLPGILANFGFIGNYSYVDAETEVERDDVLVKVPLEGMSENSWNATLYYEVPKFGARISVNNRDNYPLRNQGRNGNVSENATGPVRYDMSAFYHISDAFSLTLEGINLSDEPERIYSTGDGTMDRIYQYNFSGRQLFLGVRWNF